MNLLSRDGGRYVFHLTERDRDALRLLVRIAAGLGRNPAQLTRQATKALPPDAAARFATFMKNVHALHLNSAAEWLDDPAHCVPGKGGFGLTLLPAETEALLQAINSAKIGAWESLGS